MQIRDTLAFTLFLGDVSADREDIETALRKWGTLSASLNEEHCGDCTGVPMTCTRCVVENYYARVDRVLELVTVEGG